MSTKVVLQSKTTNEYFRLIWQGEMRWTEFPLMAYHYDSMLGASLAAIQMGIESSVEPKMVDLSKAA